MSLTRAFEEQEVPQELRRIYNEVQSSLDLPFVPTLFKLLAGAPDYFKLMWDDLGQVACSREFHTAARALEEFVRSLVVKGGWRFSDPRKVLAAQKFSSDDMDVIGNLPPVFTRTLCQMSLFSRLIQLGYAGGQRGRVSEATQAAALARIMTLNVPNERDAGLRVWLIYADIKKTTGARHVLSFFRILSPFPGYLASVWLDSKKVMADPGFLQARDQVGKRVQALAIGMPVKDHRAAGKHIEPARWREAEETVDGIARLLPQFTLVSAVWQRSVAHLQSAVA
jgi:Halocarboxylic acid dehydrogenase DehI